MQKRQFILSLGVCVTILIQACQKDTEPYPGSLADRMSHSTGIVSANLNGKPWISTLAKGHFGQGDISVISERYLNESVYESISFDNIYHMLIRNNVKKRYFYDKNYYEGHISIKEYEDGTHASFSVVDDDATIANYNIDTVYDNHILVDSYNNATHEISGRFQMRFYMETTVDKSVPDTVLLTDGAFSLKIN